MQKKMNVRIKGLRDFDGLVYFALRWIGGVAPLGSEVRSEKS